MHQQRGLVPLRCKYFARLNNCANGDEADVSFVQTQKTQSHYYMQKPFKGNLCEKLRIDKVEERCGIQYLDISLCECKKVAGESLGEIELSIVLKIKNTHLKLQCTSKLK